ncbi:TPA: hypothetical protein I7682_17670 [Vibrio vulnificus]|nr:hypothetical protein [Vibrio vulnificus]
MKIFDLVVSKQNNNKTFYTNVGAGFVKKGKNGSPDYISVKIIPNVVITEATLFLCDGAEHQPLGERLNALVSEQGNDSKTYYHRVGSGFPFSAKDKSGYSLSLDVALVNGFTLSVPKKQS